MNNRLGTILFILLLATPAFAENKVELKTAKDKLSYSAGHDMATKIKSSGADLDPAIVVHAFEDVMMGRATLMTDEDVRKTIVSYQLEKIKEISEKNKNESAAFLAENKKKEGVAVLPSGLQYVILAEGKGKRPKATDMVTVQYRGMLTDGTEFDSSYKRGQPVTVTLNQEIKGWTEGVQLIKEGGKIRLFVPSDLGFGDRGIGAQIGPNATLIFEIELLSVGQMPQSAPPSKGR